MADKTISELDAVKVGSLPPAPDIYDDTLIAVEQQGEARHITGRQWVDYAKSSVTADIKRAVDAADGASKSASDAETAELAATGSARTAGEHAEAAEKSRQAIEDMTVGAETLPTGSEATVTKTAEGGVVRLQFGLPRGEKGEKGEKGEPGKDGTGTGDMTKEVYDPTGRAEDIFAAIEQCLPVEDPGFTGLLWSEDGDGNGVQAIAGYDAGSGTKTSYYSVYSAGASAEIGTSERQNARGETVPYSYMTLKTADGKGSIEAQVSKGGAEIALRSPNETGGEKALILTTANTPETTHARLMFDDPADVNESKSHIDFIKRSDGKIRVGGIAEPEGNDEVANKRYVDEAIRRALQGG